MRCAIRSSALLMPEVSPELRMKLTVTNRLGHRGLHTHRELVDVEDRRWEFCRG